MRSSKLLIRLLRDQGGPTAVEYGLIAALISVAAITAFTAVGSNHSEGRALSSITATHYLPECVGSGLLPRLFFLPTNARQASSVPEVSSYRPKV